MLLRLLAFGLGAWQRTLRMRLTPQAQACLQQLKGPALIFFWHNRLFAMTEVRRRCCPHLPLAGLVSASADGAWLAALMEQLGVQPIRGSTSFRGAAALQGVLSALSSGKAVAITPDGPRGPCCHWGAGASWLVEHTPYPVVLVSLHYSRYWRLGSWDGFRLPWPGARLTLHATCYTQRPCLGWQDALPADE